MERRGVFRGALAAGVAAAPLATLLAESRPAAAGDRPGDADAALAALLAGNRRFVARRPRYGHSHPGPGGSAGQQPYAVVLGCVDSRVPVEAVLDQGLGDIFVARSAGAVLDRSVRGSIEFAVDKFGVPLVVVLGHSHCGAVQATLDAVRDGTRPGGDLGYLVDQIMPAVRAAGELDADRVTRTHVLLTAARLRRAGYGRPEVVGALYGIDSGRVALLR